MPAYVIRAGDTEMVKLGWSDRNAEERCAALQTANALPLTVIREIKGDRWVERALHRRFKSARIKGEWFVFHPDMLTFDPRPLASTFVPIPLSVDPLLAVVEEFLIAEGMTPTAFGISAMADPTFIPELRRGRECRRATRARAIEFMESHRASASRAAA